MFTSNQAKLSAQMISCTSTIVRRSSLLLKYHKLLTWKLTFLALLQNLINIGIMFWLILTQFDRQPHLLQSTVNLGCLERVGIPQEDSSGLLTHHCQNVPVIIPAKTSALPVHCPTLLTSHQRVQCKMADLYRSKTTFKRRILKHDKAIRPRLWTLF